MAELYDPEGSDPSAPGGLPPSDDAIPWFERLVERAQLGARRAELVAHAQSRRSDPAEAEEAADDALRVASLWRKNRRLVPAFLLGGSMSLVSLKAGGLLLFGWAILGYAIYYGRLRGREAAALREKHAS